MAKATRAAAQLKRALDVDATLTKGSGGEFTISVDGVVVYDKLLTGEFPTDQQAVRAVREAMTR
ncbi:MAG: Rdx family protein [Myxococcales bacterium]|nr:Rdx family protein [Myxococcales bacterium]MBK7191093.1 Rdx family protein [Myxococcales bacterium]MBP6849004.1 Rdx family protein [Kofleriaceae bacterium]